MTTHDAEMSGKSQPSGSAHAHACLTFAVFTHKSIVLRRSACTTTGTHNDNNGAACVTPGEERGTKDRGDFTSHSGTIEVLMSTLFQRRLWLTRTRPPFSDGESNNSLNPCEYVRRCLKATRFIVLGSLLDHTRIARGHTHMGYCWYCST
jgi:hypothetical protein